MKTYLSGPITGYPDGNQTAFYSAAEQIIERGEIPVNPHDVCFLMPKDSTWIDYMRCCIKSLADCDKIVMLPGWNGSRGAIVEWELAKALEIDVEYLDPKNYGVFLKNEAPARLEEIK